MWINFKSCTVSFPSQILIPVSLLLLASEPAAGQLTTPPFNPAEPHVLRRPTQRVIEAVDTRKWRRRYNAYELIVLSWQIYWTKKRGGDWRDIFRQVTGLMESELDLHRDYYEGLSEADAVVTQYHLIADIRAEFRGIMTIAATFDDAVSNPDIWADAEQRAFFLDASRQIKQQSLATLSYLPLVAGVDVQGWEHGREITAADHNYWASAADRIQHLERMHGELTALRILINQLHEQISMTAQHRRSLVTERSSLRDLFGTN